MTTLQAKMQALLDSLVASGAERGLQLAVYRDGKLVLDLAAGTMNAAGDPMTPATLVPSFSVTKGMVATILHRLVERVAIGYDTPIASVWPEFAAEGKGNILLRHALNHTAGLQLMPADATNAQICDWEEMTAALARAKPVSAPGSEYVYHAVTFGWILGEVARRVTGKPFARLLEEEITRPLGIADEMYVGIPASAEPRVAELEEVWEPGTEPKPPTPLVPATVAWGMMPLHAWMNGSLARRACVPASNGIMTARAIARHYAALVPGGVEGVELLSPQRVKVATAAQLPANLPANPPAIQMSLGYFAGADTRGDGKTWFTFGHGGYGGANGFACPELRLGVGLTKNYYSKAAGHERILSDLWAALAEAR